MAAKLKIKRDDFICRCGKEAKRADKLIKEVCSRLSHPNHTVTKENLLSAVIYNSEFHKRDSEGKYLGPRGGFDITGFPYDQWGAVTATEKIWNPEIGKYGQYEDGESIFIQCDEFEDGVAAVWKYFADKYE